MTHQMIRRFQVTGETTDDNFIKARNNCHRELLNSMKDMGYIQLLDIDPFWRVSYSGDRYEFEYTMHGIHIGEGAWEYAGVIQGKLIPSTPKSK